MAYHSKINGVNSTSSPLSGNYLAYNHLGLIPRAFLAADLVSGARYLTAPTQTQAATLARVNRCYVHWAIERQAQRAAIEAGLIPLIPLASSSPVVSETNGTALTATSGMDDARLVQLVRSVGIDRLLDAAIQAEAH